MCFSRDNTVYFLSYVFLVVIEVAPAILFQNYFRDISKIFIRCSIYLDEDDIMLEVRDIRLWINLKD